MEEPRVRNRNEFPRSRTLPMGNVYIGRGMYSIWGNPFIIGVDGDRDEVIGKYEAWIVDQPDIIAQAKLHLKGKDLVCFCAPLRCHGDVLLRIANE